MLKKGNVNSYLKVGSPEAGDDPVLLGYTFSLEIER